MLIEPANRADIPTLCDLLAMLFATETDFPVNRAAQERGLRAILDDPGCGTVLVARDAHGAVVGAGSVLYTISTAAGGRAAVFEDLVVRPEARGRGVGTALLRALIAHARAQGCLRISLLTNADNVGAQRLYLGHGFVASTMRTMRRSVSGAA